MITFSPQPYPLWARDKRNGAVMERVLGWETSTQLTGTTTLIVWLANGQRMPWTSLIFDDWQDR